MFLLKKKDCRSPSQYRHTIVFLLIINNNPPLLVSLPKVPTDNSHHVSLGVTKHHAVTYLDQRREDSETAREERRMRAVGGRSVKEECSIMYSRFVQVTVGSNAAVTHLKLALACLQRRTEALQALANPYSPDTCSAWRILRY